MPPYDTDEENENGGRPEEMATPNKADAKRLEVEAWHAISEALRRLEPSAQERVLRSVTALYDIPLFTQNGSISAVPAPIFTNPPFSGSEERVLSPKEFMLDKRPTTDVDRVACLAYYLAHNRNTPHFKTLDLSQLNTEAAQIKFSNAAQAVDNANKAGLLVPAVAGQKQISALGEMYVQALPDKIAARAAIEGYRRKRARRASQGQVAADENE